MRDPTWSTLASGFMDVEQAIEHAKTRLPSYSLYELEFLWSTRRRWEIRARVEPQASSGLCVSRS